MLPTRASPSVSESCYLGLESSKVKHGNTMPFPESPNKENKKDVVK